MKYIYKHGNQYWYQRAIPSSLVSLLGKRTIKISLKTNKIPIALKRAKLQSIEHKKLFQNLNQRKFKVKIFKKIDISKYSIKFLDDFDDLTSNILLNKKEIIQLLKNSQILNETQSIENIIFKNKSRIDSLRDHVDSYLKIKKIKSKTQKYSSFINSINYLIKICGDKPIEEFNVTDSSAFRDFFVKKNRISTGRRYQSNIVNFFKTMLVYLDLEKKNPFDNVSWPTIEKNSIDKIFSNDEIKLIKNFIKNSLDDPYRILFGIMLDTGCSPTEIVGIELNEINLNQFNPYFIIRSNEVRKVVNIYKRRTVPLVGSSLKSVNELLNISKNNFPFSYFFDDKFLFRNLDNKLNLILKKLIGNKTVQCFKYTLIQRLKDISCPEEVISEIIGIKKRSLFYQNDINIEMKLSWLSQIASEN